MIFNLHYITQYIIESKNSPEYIKKIPTKFKKDGIFQIIKEDLIPILQKSNNPKSKQYLEQINNNTVSDGLVVEIKDHLDIGNQVFTYNQVTVMYIIDQQMNYYLKGKEIAEILGYNDSKRAIQEHIDTDDKFYFDTLQNNLIMNPSITSTSKNGELTQQSNPSTNIIDVIHPKTIFINESGLYSLILRSNKEQAKQFKKWVTSEVLPALRKSGKYIVDPFNVKDYQDKNCLYLFNVKQDIYKFGITCDITKRMSKHRSAGLIYNLAKQLVDIFTFDKYDDVRNVENIIKRYTKDNNLSLVYNQGTEFFKGSLQVVDIIKKLITDYKEGINIHKFENYQQDKITSSIQLISLQNKNVELQIEKETKLKQLDYDHQVKMKQIENNFKLKENDQQIKLKELELQIEQARSVAQVDRDSKLGLSISNQKIKKCLDCDKLVLKRTTRCSECEYKRRFLSNKNNRPSYEQLLLDSETMSYVQMGKKYSVTDNAVRKWMKSYAKYS